MLIAPIFHNSYLSPKPSDSQNKPSDAVSTSSSSTKTSEASSSVKYNNIFKSAFNRGITFLSKIANSSGSNTPSTSASTSSKPAESEVNHDSSSSETPSDCSSPDSLKTEMIFFKPITREPRTPSSAKPVLLRVPSIRSTTASSTDRLLNSPCPSPFFIPITPRRQLSSAFSFVAINEEEADSQPVIKPRPTKRKNVKMSPEKSNLSPKRIKRDVQTSQKSSKSREVLDKPKVEAKTEKRKTRSMEKKNYAEDDDEMFCIPTAVTTSRRKTLPKSPAKKSSPKKQPAPKVVEKQKQKRVLRSQSMKH